MKDAKNKRNKFQHRMSTDEHNKKIYRKKKEIKINRIKIMPKEWGFFFSPGGKCSFLREYAGNELCYWRSQCVVCPR